jgi:hypothetical protein
MLLIYAMFAAIAFLVSASLAGLHTGALPRWLAIAGFVTAVLLVFGFAFIPQVFLVVWVLAASIVLIRSPREQAPGGTPAT